MAKLKYVNSNNKSVELGNAAPFLILTVDGLGSPQNEIYTQKSPYQDGVTVTGSSLESRNIVIEGKIIDSNRANRQIYRNTLLSVLNPKLSGKLIIDLGNEQRQIECKVEQAPYFASGSGQNHQDFSVSLIAPNPYFQDIAESKTDISTETGNLEFPLEIPVEGLELSIRTISYITNIYNQGDVDTPIKVKLKAVGTVINPIIENLNTGEFIRIKRTLLEGDTLEINTEFGNKRVEIIKEDGSRENVFHYIDYKSTFFSLTGGDNTIKYDAEVGENNLDVSIYYTPNYLGI